MPQSTLEFLIFLSSPGDVPQERDAVQAVIEEINASGEFINHWRLRLYRWDDEKVVLPMPATQRPQKSVDLYMIRPSACDLVLCIFWARMGAPLVIDDKPYLSGTHYEYSDALQGHEATGKPDIWLYRCMEEAMISQRDPERDEKVLQYDRLDEFFAGFKTKEGQFLGWVNEYPSHAEFKAKFKAQLLTYLRHLRDKPKAEPTESAGLQNRKQATAIALPAKTYTRLVGRKQQIERITSLLKNPKSAPILSIIGQGGMGKTTLAREALELCMSDFDYILWASGQTESLSANKLRAKDADIQDFESLLDILGEQLQIAGLVKLGLNAKRLEIQKKLQEIRALIVLDNMETVRTAQALVDNLFQIQGQAKVLITSRYRDEHELAFVMNLDKMQEEEGIEFIRAYAEDTNNEALMAEDEATFREIYNSAGGQPLAMKLIVSQMSQRPKQTVFQKLQGVRPEFGDFYNYLYRNSWNILNDDAKNLLIAMTVPPPNTDFDYMMLQALSLLDDEAFDEAIAQLRQLSLVDKSGSASEPYFSLHPLVHHFVLSQITKETE